MTDTTLLLGRSSAEVGPPADEVGGPQKLPLSQRYKLVEQQSVGSDGSAFRAVDRETGREVDVRRLSCDLNGDRTAAIAAHLRLLATWKHPAGLQILDMDLAGRPATVVLERSQGPLLSDWMDGGPTARERLYVADQLCEAVQAAHRVGLTCAQLESSRIRIDEQGVRLDLANLRTERQSPSDNTAELPQLSRLIAALLGDKGTQAALRAVSPRLLAALHHLLRSATAVEETQRPLLTDLAAGVGQLWVAVNSSTDRRDSASKESHEPADPNKTAEVVLPPQEPAFPDLADDRTSENVPVSAAEPPRPAQRALRPGEQLGRYRIEAKIGEGGMGSVFRATDVGDGQVVAIKTLNASSALNRNALRRFHKEGRLLAEVNNPHVTNLLQVNEDDGCHYMALEFVDGTDLKQVLARVSPLPERQSLKIASDVARALVDAHERGIVHRDIKPENILLEGQVFGDGDNSQIREPIRIKLSDFGIARYVDQSESLAVTQAGAILGTPRYMSPEQCRGQADVVPQSDIYSLGITLFELLTGAPPFSADDPMKLAAMHCFDAPPLATKQNPAVSEAAAKIVAKALAKQPEDRYADAGQMLRDLDQLLLGEPADIGVHPLLPSCDSTRLFEADFSWNLRSSAKELWPFVSNTERLNRAVGLPPVEYRTEFDEAEGIRKYGSFRLAGIPISWEEHPFEWVEGHRMGILREFDRGPFEWFMSVVELTPLADGGTRLSHRVRIVARNLLGRGLAKLEAGIKGRKSLDRVYRRIDRTLGEQAQQSSLRDPFEPPSKLSRPQQARLEQRLERIVERGTSPMMASLVGEFIASAPTPEVAKIRPWALADRLGQDRDETLETLLLASSEGLLAMYWDVLCPTCRVTADTKSTLKELRQHTFCEACNVDFESDVANSVELVFRAHNDLRDSQVGKYCIGGPEHSPHVVAQVRLAPGERLELELALASGDYLLRGPQLPQSFDIRVQATSAPSQSDVTLDRHSDARFVTTLRSGRQLLRLTNGYPTPQLVRVERTICRQDVVTAARASALSSFRRFFPGEVFERGRHVSAEQVTLLVTHIANLDELSQTFGEADTYGLVQDFVEAIDRRIQERRGALVKVSSTGVVAAFDDVAEAVSVAVKCHELAARSLDAQLNLGVGVHRGPAIVTTVNDRLDYFGSTERVASALPLLGPGRLLLTETVFADPVVTELLAELGQRGNLSEIELPGGRQLVQSFCTTDGHGS